MLYTNIARASRLMSMSNKGAGLKGAAAGGREQRSGLFRPQGQNPASTEFSLSIIVIFLFPAIFT